MDLMPRKRRRAIPSDFDPVYPYDRQSFVISAPFVNTDKGLTTDPPGFIALKVKPPLTFDNQGNLILVGGGGDNVDTSKGLGKSGNTIFVKISGPLQFDNSGNIIVSVNQAKGLLVENGDLVLNADPAYFSFNQGMLSLAQGSLPSTNIDTTKGLDRVNNKLVVKLTTPLQFNAQGQIGLNVQAPLIQQNGALGINDSNYLIKGAPIPAPLVVVPGSGTSAPPFIDFRQSATGTRYGFIGKASSDNNDIVLSSSNDLRLEGTVFAFGPLVIMPSTVSTTQPFIDFKSSKTGNRFGYIGKGTASNSDIYVNSAQNLRLEAGSSAKVLINRPLEFNSGSAIGTISTSGNSLVVAATNTLRLNGSVIASSPIQTPGIKLQSTNNISTFIAPTAGAIKLNFSNSGVRFSQIDLENQTRIINCMDPSNGTDVANKNYVDAVVRNGNIGPVVNLDRDGNNFPLVSFNNTNGDRLGYVGMANSQSNNIKLSANENLQFETLDAQNGIIISNAPFRYAGAKQSVFGTGILFWGSAGECYLGGKQNLVMKFKDPDTQTRIVNLNMENQTRITNLPNPLNEGDPINLSYMRSTLQSVYSRVAQAQSQAGATLWAGNAPLHNARPDGQQAFDQTLGLSLTLVGGTVMGTLFFEGDGQYGFLPLQTDSLTFTLQFDEFGHLTTNCALDTTHWGQRTKVQPLNVLGFVPDPDMYLPNRDVVSSSIIKKLYVGGDVDHPLTLKIQFNLYQPYSISFTFSGLTNPEHQGKQLRTSIANFSYLGKFPVE